MRLAVLLIGLSLLGASVAARTSPAASDPVMRYVAEQAAKRGFSGTLLIAKDGSPANIRAFGLADRAFQVPAAPDTRYRVASITKTFTAAIVLQLVDEGRLRL